MQRKIILFPLLFLLIILLAGCGKPNGYVSGKVVDQHGNGIVGAIVTVPAPSFFLMRSSEPAVTNLDGTFSLLANLAEWSRITVEKDGVFFVQTRHDLKEGKLHGEFTGYTQFTSIQEQIDAAHDGDTIYVCPGTYIEVIDFTGKEITVRALQSTKWQDIRETVIDGSTSNAPVVTFAKGETSTSRLEGFILRHGIGNIINGKTYGGGIYIQQASPTIENCQIEKSTATFGGGLYIGQGAKPRLQNVRISNNFAFRHGGGIFVEGASQPLILGSVITMNEAQEQGGGIWLGSDCILQDMDRIPLTPEQVRAFTRDNQPADLYLQEVLP